MKRSNIWDWLLLPHFIYLVLEKRPNYHVCKSGSSYAAELFVVIPLEKQMGNLGAWIAV